MNEPKVSIIIVTWNNEKEIRPCLKSILKIDYQDLNVVVVDNNSTDRTVNIIETDFTEVKLIKLGSNIFLTGGNNIGIRYVLDFYSPKYIMVLNPDTSVEKNLLKILVPALEKNKDAGAAGPKIKFSMGRNKGKLNSAGLEYDGFMQAYDRGFLEKDKGQYDKPEVVLGVSGTCILYRAEALRMAGLYWKPIKMYLDDLEMCIRLRKKGWKIRFEPGTVVWHDYMVSSKQNKSLKINDQKIYAWLLIALRHYPLKSKLAMIAVYLKHKLGMINRS